MCSGPGRLSACPGADLLNQDPSPTVRPALEVPVLLRPIAPYLKREPTHLVNKLAADYPGSLHVRSVGLRSKEDVTIWEYARQNDLAIVSKDQRFSAVELS